MVTVAMAIGELSPQDDFFEVSYMNRNYTAGMCSSPDLVDSDMLVATGERGSVEILYLRYTWLFLLVFILLTPVILQNLLVSFE